MNSHYLQSLLDETINTVGVRFNLAAGSGASKAEWSAKVYTYKTRLKFAVNDHAVVESPGGLAVVKVVRVDEDPQLDPDTMLAYKWVVQKVDAAAYEAQTKADADFAVHVTRMTRNKHRSALRKAILDEYPELLALQVPKPACDAQA